jgi:hypothetical protein
LNIIIIIIQEKENKSVENKKFEFYIEKYSRKNNYIRKDKFDF